MALKALIVSALAVTAAAASLRASMRDGDVETNVCNMYYNACARDPGCVTYTMSPHSVVIHANGMTKPIKAEDLKAGDVINLIVKGETTLTSVPSAGSYRIYELSGHNAAEGVLTDVMTLDAPYFTIDVTFTLQDGNFNFGSHFVEWGLDVFQEKSGSDEAFCLEFSDVEYIEYEKNKPSPPFEQYCKDDGNGHWTADKIPVVTFPVPSESCTAPSSDCSLKWNLCPRDPGCKTYDASPVTVTVDVHGKKLAPGVEVVIQINGTTQLTSIPPQGSYRIYSLAGKNMGTGTLVSHLQLFNCESKGCHFGLTTPVTLTDDAFNSSKGWFEMGVDVFRESSGTLEGMCVEISNPTYLKAEQNDPGHPFVQLCVDEGWGHYKAETVPEVVHDAICKLE